MLRREFLLSAAAAAYAQDDATFSTEVKVVNVFATVRSKRGEIVSNLDKTDFSILEKGRPQTIRYFSRETDLPLTIGLMVDTSMSQEKVLEAERSASYRFLDQVLRAQDQVFIMQFDMGVQTPQPLTSSRKDLEEALAYVDTPSRRELNMGGNKGTVLYDAIVQASKTIMQNQRNRKALIVLSDGVDVGSDASVADAIDAALQSDTLIYSIEFSDATFYRVPFIPMGGPDGKGILIRLAKETGGSFFSVSKKLGIDQIFDLIQKELRSQYSLGFVSDEPVRISEFRKLQVATRDKGLIVQARERYWAKR